MEDYLIIGKVLKPQGIRGEIKVKPLTDNIKRFDDLPWLYIDFGEEKIRYNIEGKRHDDRFAYLKLYGINTIEEARTLVGRFIWIDREHAVPLPEGSYYVADIIGCRVYTSDGQYLGNVKSVFPTGSNDVYVVSDGHREILLPAIKSVIELIDVRVGQIVVNPLEGLLE